jgi:hypothetical protein
MSDCKVETSLDKFLSRYNRLISDKFVLFCLYLFILSIFLGGIYYVVKDLYKIITTYYAQKSNVSPSKPKNKQDVDPTNSGANPSDPSADNEFYATDDESIPKQQFGIAGPFVAKDSRDPGEKKFYDMVDTKYNEYNTKKTQYIAQIYQGQSNDDIIDDNIVYSKYDDYSYKNKDDGYDYSASTTTTTQTASTVPTAQTSSTATTAQTASTANTTQTAH